MDGHERLLRLLGNGTSGKTDGGGNTLSNYAAIDTYDGGDASTQVGINRCGDGVIPHGLSHNSGGKRAGLGDNSGGCFITGCPYGIPVHWRWFSRTGDRRDGNVELLSYRDIWK